MRAVLLFSAVLHIAAIGMLAAYALRSWVDKRRPKEPSVPETVLAAAALAASVAVVGTILMWMGRGFPTALLSGLVAGLLAALVFLLSLGAIPHPRPSFAEPASLYVRVGLASLVAALLLTEMIAFCLLVATAGGVDPYS